VSKIFTNPNQLEEWVDAALGIEDRFGIERALDYVIGDKFYNLVAILHSARKIVRTIDEERKKPDYNPIRVTKFKGSEVATNLEKTYEDEKANVIETEGLLVKFVFLINQAFSPHEILKYFHSNPQLGILISTKEEHEFLVRHGAMEYSIDNEVEDALIFGDMMKYFGVSSQV
jgi:hypothetical protein